MFLIDGHNLIGRSREIDLADGGAGREKLLARIAAAKGAKGQSVWVLFDGDRARRAEPKRFGGLHVAYAPAGITADEEILRRVEKAGPGRATVVTSDRGLADRARARGASVVSAEAFLSRLERPRGGPAPEKPAPSADDVEHWLAAFKKPR